MLAVSILNSFQTWEVIFCVLCSSKKLDIHDSIWVILCNYILKIAPLSESFFYPPTYYHPILITSLLWKWFVRDLCFNKSWRENMDLYYCKDRLGFISTILTNFPFPLRVQTAAQLCEAESKSYYWWRGVYVLFCWPSTEMYERLYSNRKNFC